MRIAFIVGQFPALSETFILRQITGLLDRGHEVDIYAYCPAKESQVHPDVKSYKLLERTNYLSEVLLMPENKVARLGRGILHIIKNFHRNPRAILNSLNVFKFGNKAASLHLLYQSIPFLDKGPYDIIHCQFGPNGKLAIGLRDAAVLQGKVITTFRGYDVSSYLRTNGENVYNDLFKKGDFFFTVSEKIKDKVIKLGCNPDKVAVHRSGVNTQIPSLSVQPKSNDNVKVLTIARLIEKKGVAYGIRAVAKVLKQYPGTEYKIAGDGPLRSVLEGQIHELNIANNVKLIGWQSQEQVQELLEESDILLAPSVTGQNGDEEGIPGVIMEALSLGLPVISTQHSGIPEVVHDGESGFLVPERDADALAERLACLVQQPDLRSEMGQKGQRHVEKHYNIDKLNDSLVTLYGQLLDRHLSNNQADTLNKRQSVPIREI